MARIERPKDLSEIDHNSAKHQVRYFDSTFDFLNWHKGIRPYCLSGLISTTGAGKSTLMKTIVAQTAETKKVLVWLSEEKIDDYVAGIAKLCDYEKVRENLRFFHESNLPEKVTTDQKSLFQFFREAVIEADCNFIFIDNITTGILYAEHWKAVGQYAAARFLSNYCRETGNGIFYLAHTAKDVRRNQDAQIDFEDIRGNRQLASETEYAYVMQVIYSKQKPFVFITIPKHRYHTPEKNFYFMLVFKNNSYVKDCEVDFETISSVVAAKDQFGRGAKSTRSETRKTPSAPKRQGFWNERD